MARLLASVTCGLLVAQSMSARAADVPVGHSLEVSVSAATRLDWIYALANQSPAEPPAGLLDNYDSTKQTYELFVPEQYSPIKSWPVVLFVSPGNRGTGFQRWQQVCRREQVIFASPHAAGNNTPMPNRIRIVMDVLDDLRRRYNVDPDRTYIGGFSGGGRVACSIAFALPEYFGGVLPVCAGGELRQESSLRRRVIDRLSVAQLTGETDFNRGECERLHHTSLSGVGVRCRTWVAPKTGHAIPNAGIFTEAFNWLEAGLPDRRNLAKRWPASSLKDAVSREEWAKRLLREGQERLQRRDTFHSGLMQVKSVQVRWNDLPTAKQALRILTKAEQDPDQSWQKDDVAEQRTFLIARARAVDAYGSGPLPKQYERQRESMLTTAIQLWGLVLQDGQNKAAVAEAKRRIPQLEALLKQ
ncbi:MAG: hypothetical protein ACYTGL_28260 [Planctomycetota bacterium]